VRDYAFYKFVSEPATLLRRCAVPCRRLLRRLLRPYFRQQVHLFNALDADIHRLAQRLDTVAAARQEIKESGDARKTGVTREVRAQYPDIVEEEFWGIAQRCLPHTLILIERLYNIYKSVEYICRHNIPGEFVECGVARGGSVMAAGDALAHFGSTDRKFYLYDTFNGMTPPGADDVDFTGQAQKDIETSLVDHPDFQEETRRNLRHSRYPFGQIVFVKGPVQRTIPGVMPEAIAYLRLDTDWYDSTRHELEHLYPRVVRGGVVIIDDYGHFLGARKAVDEYFAASRDRILLHRVDYTCRAGTKPC
jgi:hypothetical protein